MLSKMADYNNNDKKGWYKNAEEDDDDVKNRRSPFCLKDFAT